MSRRHRPEPTASPGARAERGSGADKLVAGTTYRFRQINILTETSVRVALLRDGEPVVWRATAEDGAELSPPVATVREARLTFMSGEVRDFEFTPEVSGELVLGFGKGAPWQT